MNRDEAAREAARLAEENPGRRWLPREGEDGEWAVAEIKLPAGMKPNPPLKETIERAAAGRRRPTTCALRTTATSAGRTASSRFELSESPPPRWRLSQSPSCWPTSATDEPASCTADEIRSA